jgi:crotonobetainyl-CoA:carnitine CoA-transferase CaiB-like acyl-CoA transferase
MEQSFESQPLHGLRILDLCDGIGDSCGRYLADLGAEVILVEAVGGSPARNFPPLIDGQSAWFATHAANKQSTVLDIHSRKDCSDFIELAQAADIILYSRSPSSLAWLSKVTHLIDEADSTLIALAISDFGDSGPYSKFTGSNPVHLAMAGVTARSGVRGREPLLPPGQLAQESAAIQAAWVALVAYWQRLHTGYGGCIDFSIFESCCQILDPALGVTGSASGGKSATKLAPHSRPPVGKMYPFFECADGFVRICVLNPRQWQAMSEWLGKDHPFTDPVYARMGKRHQHLDEINALIQKMFINENGDDLVAEGQRRGVPIAAVASPQKVLTHHHFNARKAFSQIIVSPNKIGKAPSGFLKINGVRAGMRRPAPQLGSHQAQFKSEGFTPTQKNQNKDTGRHPLEGIRVLDLGVIVAGAELGRLFADQGAEVIKIESSAYADGLRQSVSGDPISESFAQGSRGKKSLGLNLRSKEGKHLFKELVAKSDIVLSNFKPGTMDSLGFGYSDLKTINPRIIVSESSALGGSGPMSKSMGYGPLVRANSGLTGLWRYPDEESSFGDSVTIFPDHLAARVSAVAILALLINRERTGKGGTVSLSQAETIMMCLGPELLKESLEPGWLQPCGNRGRYDAPSNIFHCAGDDEWCAIDIRGDKQWQALCHLMDRPDLLNNSRFDTAGDRVAANEYLEQQVADWTISLEPNQLVENLQQAGIAAGKMFRVNELPDNPHLRARDFFRVNHQPSMSGPLLTENGPAGKFFFPEPKIEPAPFAAQHTRMLMTEILGLENSEVNALLKSGDLEEMEDFAN